MTFEDELEQWQRDLDESEKLIEQGRFEEVLKKVLKEFDHIQRDKRNWHNHRIFGKLASRYPRAVSAFRERRDRLEEIILEQRADTQVLHDWEDLNSVLEEKLRTLDVYNQLVARKADQKTLDHLLFYLWKRLVKERRYSELRSYLRSMAFHIFLNIAEHDSSKIFPSDRFENPEEVLADQLRIRDWIAKDGPLVFEAALGLGRQDVADALMKKMTRLEPSDRIYSKLITAAVRAKSYDLALDLHKSAQLALDSTKMKKTNNALELIPDDQLPKA